MKKHAYITRIVVAILLAAAMTLIAYFGVLDTLDGIVSDRLYQSGEAADGEIVVIGIDQKALDNLGPFPWSRIVLGDAISYLNSGEEKPAVIGIDVLFVGASGDPEADEYLANSAEYGGNLVVASAATFGSTLKEAGSSFYINDRSILAYDKPYSELTNYAKTGHINTMADKDGIIRHAILSIDVPDTGKVYSFSRVIYEKYCDYKHIEPNPLPDRDVFYIPYTSKGGGYYDFISVWDLYNCEVDPEIFAGKIALIGPYAPGLQDEYRTAIDHAAPTYGVEIQANLVDAFRKGFYPKQASKTLELIILFVVCLIMFLLFYNRSVLISLLMEIAVSGGFVLLAWLLYNKAGIVLHVLWIPLFVTVLFIGSVAANYIRASHEKRMVTNTFGRYVDPAIMKELLETGTDALELGGKTYDIAVLFVDVRGFTTMSEALDPPTVVEIINQYLTLTTECIMKNHGTLDKFVGDCTMAFWNAPLPQEDPVYLACCAAMDMVEGSKELGEKLQEKYGRSVSFGVGVNWGPAVVGNIGAPLRMDYTAIGDTVNTAARLEANAPGGKILISRAVADILGDRAKVTSLGSSIKLKGKAEGFEVLTLDELKK